MSADYGYYEHDGTVASAGIPALPATGSQPFFYLSFVGSSLFKDGDVAVFGLRHASTPTATNDTLTFDVRLPTNGRLRLNPRLALSSARLCRRLARAALGRARCCGWCFVGRDATSSSSSSARASRRVSSRCSASQAPAPDEELTEKFLNAGFWWELE